MGALMIGIHPHSKWVMVKRAAEIERSIDEPDNIFEILNDEEVEPMKNNEGFSGRSETRGARNATYGILSRWIATTERHAVTANRGSKRAQSKH